MTVLGIDTSSRRRSVCVLATAHGELVRSDVRLTMPVSTAVPPSLASLLGPDIEAVVVVTGPGSYTGLRAGMAAALGIAQTRDLPMHGIGTLEVVAAGAGRAVPGGTEFWAAVDAGRGGLYVARCSCAGEQVQCAEPRREAAGSLALGGLPLVSPDPIGLPGLVTVDVAAALAAAVPQALSKAPLARSGLTAVYVD